MAVADNLFYVVTGTEPVELHIAQSVIGVRRKAGTLCNYNLAPWVIRPTDRDIQSLPICETCQEIFDDYEDGLSAQRRSSHG